MIQGTTAFHCVICADERVPAVVQEAVKGDQHNMLEVVRCTTCGHYQLNPPNYSIDHYKEDGQVNFVVHDYGTPIEKIVEHSWIEAARRISLEHKSPDRSLRVLDIGGGYTWSR